MEYEIFGGNLPALSVNMEPGESIYTQSGGMSWMTDGIEMSTNVKGGLMKGLGRMFSGESLFLATYTAQRPGTQITLASSLPGEIRVFDIGPGREYIAQKGAFLCAQPGVELSADANRKVSAGFFGGDGFVLQHYRGQGLAFLELDGSIREYDLLPGQILKVDSGSVAAFEATVDYTVETVKGFKNALFGGEGLFLTVLTGPGKVWLQTMPISALAARIVPFVPVQHSN